MLSMSWRERIETIRAAHPLEVVAAQYTELRHQGHDLVGQCPVRAERTPSFTVTPRAQKWFCFGCNTGGDVFKLVELVEHVTFREALVRLESQAPSAFPARVYAPLAPRVLRPDERDLLTQVANLYHAALLQTPAELAYLERRRITRDTIAQYRLGYARPGEVLARFRSDADRARLMSLGVLNDQGQERFRYRVMIPEWRKGQVVFLIGRARLTTQRAKYLALTGLDKPLYGLERLDPREPVVLTEGPFDWLTLVQWDTPALSLLGTHLKASQVAELAAFPKIWIATDSDEPGWQAAAQLVQQLGARARRVPSLPGGVKDLNELAERTDGRAQWAELLAPSAGEWITLPTAPVTHFA